MVDVKINRKGVTRDLPVRRLVVPYVCFHCACIITLRDVRHMYSVLCSRMQSFVYICHNPLID